MRKNIDKQKKAIYSAAALMLCATALLCVWFTNKDGAQKVPESSTNNTQVTNTEPKTQVNLPVTNIPDERDTVTTAPSSAYFALPSENKIIKHFSGGEMVKNTTTGDWRTHTGTDIAGAVGDPIKSISDGMVTGVRDDELWGTIVTVDCGNGIIAEYRGLGRGSTPDVGETVKINDKIGNLGEIPIEKADGVHLHIEVCENVENIDPVKIMGQTYEFKTQK